MAETWPGTLPQYVNRDGFSYSVSNPSLTFVMSTGYTKRRKKYSGQYANYKVLMDMTRDQLDIFEQFFNNNLGYGVVAINFPDPLFLTSTIEVKIKTYTDMVPYTVVPFGDNDDVVVSFELEQLVTGYNTVSIGAWPTSLPDCPQYFNYSSEVQSGIIRDTSGYVNVRRRFTAVTRYHNMSMILTPTELETFIDFYGSLGYGSKSFNAPYPADPIQTIKARFDAGKGYSLEYYNDTNLFLVSFIWEELPPLLGWN